MTRAERGALSQHICNFYYDSANKSVETLWTILERKVYEKTFQDIIEGVRKKLRAMWQDGLYSIL
jgi:hypothetical protein